MKPIRCAPAVLACLLSVACFQVEQKTTVYPNGSGKLVFHVAMGSSLTEMAKMGGGMGQPGGPGSGPGGAPGGKGGAPGGDLSKLSDPKEAMKNFEGIVAWSEPVKTEDDDWTKVTLVGYFDDINKLKMYQGEGEARKLQVEYKLEKTDKGWTLSAKDETSGEFGKMGEQMKGPGGQGGDDEMAKGMMAAMKPMLKGLKMGFAVIVPGAVTDSSGFLKTEGRTASVEMSDKDLFAMIEGKKEAAEKFKNVSASRKISWTENSVTADEEAAFAAELAKAKETWKDLEAKWKAGAGAKKEEKKEEKTPTEK